MIRRCTIAKCGEKGMQMAMCLSVTVITHAVFDHNMNEASHCLRVACSPLSSTTEMVREHFLIEIISPCALNDCVITFT